MWPASAHLPIHITELNTVSALLFRRVRSSDIIRREHRDRLGESVSHRWILHMHDYSNPLCGQLRDGSDPCTSRQSTSMSSRIASRACLIVLYLAQDSLRKHITGLDCVLWGETTKTTSMRDSLREVFVTMVGDVVAARAWNIHGAGACRGATSPVTGLSCELRTEGIEGRICIAKRARRREEHRRRGEFR